MRTRIFTSFLIITMVNYLIGCYSSQKVEKEEVFKSDQMITEVVLQNADVIIFDERGGTYQSIDSSLVGFSISDERYRILNINSISEFRTEITPSVEPDEIGNEMITEVVNINNRLFKFSEKGGWYDKDRKLIIGVGVNNDIISFKIILLLNWLRFLFPSDDQPQQVSFHQGIESQVLHSLPRVYTYHYLPLKNQVLIDQSFEVLL